MFHQAERDGYGMDPQKSGHYLHLRRDRERQVLAASVGLLESLAICQLLLHVPQDVLTEVQVFCPGTGGFETGAVAKRGGGEAGRWGAVRCHGGIQH